MHRHWRLCYASIITPWSGSGLLSTYIQNSSLPFEMHERGLAAGFLSLNWLHSGLPSPWSQKMYVSGVHVMLSMGLFSLFAGTKHTDSRSGNALSIRRTSSDSGAPPLLDRLPCQLAYAPSTLDALLDWLLLDPFRARRSGLDSGQEISPCPLGPSLSVYLMLRAICRQCDRWEALENRKMAAESVRKLRE